MITKNTKKILEKQGYRFVGNHSAVKICLWTRKSLTNSGECYKSVFYGIKSYECCQMTPFIECENKCLHCWRPIEFNLKINRNKVDNPKKIIEGCILAQRKLLSGFGGGKKTNMKKFREAKEPKHFSISLIGEATLYPKLAELIKELRKQHKTSFLVTNGLNPEKIKELIKKNALPTQLTVSLNAPNKILHQKICRSCKKNAWKKFNETLSLMKNLKCRTVVRLTLIKEVNMKEELIKQYAELIKIASPLFIHVKGYACRGYSKKRISYKKMPRHEEVKEFSKKLLKYLKNYKFLGDKFESNVVLLGRDKKRMKIRDEEI